MRMHADQLTVPVTVVRRLVAEQFPAWADARVAAVASGGTDNALFRVGEHLVARFPLRPGDVDEVRRGLTVEADAARELVGRVRFPTPEPVAMGAPGPGYPLPWAVQTWLPGHAATDDDPAGSTAFARDLADLVRDLRSIPLAGRRFAGSGRGGELRSHDDWIATCFERSESLLDVSRLRRLWAGLRELPRVDPDVMTHGDLIPGNVLVSHDVEPARLAGLLDVGGLGAADPALDLVGAWHLLDDEPRCAFRAELGCDDLQWARGAAWAFEQAMGVVWYYVDSNAAMSAMGRRTIDRILRADLL
jgi:aminoglycoside phosphotransferase (APT) family kinase protein